MNVIQYMAFEEELKKVAGAKRVRRLIKATEKARARLSEPGHSYFSTPLDDRFIALSAAKHKAVKKWTRRVEGESKLSPVIGAAYRKRVGAPGGRWSIDSLAERAIKAGPKAPTSAIGTTYKATNKFRKAKATLERNLDPLRWEGGPGPRQLRPLRSLRGFSNKAFMVGDKALRKTKDRVAEILSRRRRAAERERAIDEFLRNRRG